MKRQKGFTLIELLVVITIIGILAAVGLASYRTANQKARDSRREADIQQVRSALEAFRAECDTYPIASTWSGLMASSCNAGAVVFVDTFLGGRPVNDPGALAYEYDSADGSSYELRYTSEITSITETFRNP